MENLNQIFKTILFLGLVSIAFACEWTPSDEAEMASYPKNGEIFIDGFSGGLEYFPFAGSKLDAFSVDTETYYEGTASMRFDVPNGDDPNGNYAGAIFPDLGGRNLADFDALTFWAKASKATTIDQIGFGTTFEDARYTAGIFGLRLSTSWTKYHIPIPDPAKLERLQGLFSYATGAKPEGLEGEGFTFWIDELQFEYTGTIAHPRPVILNGEDKTEQTFIGIQIPVSGLQHTFNLGNGLNQTVSSAPAYFDFESSNENVATVNELGIITVVGTGSAEITAVSSGVQAFGSLTIESLGEFISAPTPTKDPANVISIFSDAYTNVAIDYYNGFFQYQTTQGGTGPGGADFTVNGDAVINYTELNFVGIGAFQNVPSIDATAMTHLHVDIQVQESINPGDFIRLQLLNSVGSGETSGSYTISDGVLKANQWISLNIPLTDFAGLTDRSKIGLLFFISDNTVSNILVDNIYFYK
ncbi:MAG: Ig-like domain-containing protein [Bacteroidota bacterium]